jgi:hypothetical protein
MSLKKNYLNNKFTEYYNNYPIKIIIPGLNIVLNKEILNSKYISKNLMITFPNVLMTEKPNLFSG